MLVRRLVWVTGIALLVAACAPGLPTPLPSVVETPVPTPSSQSSIAVATSTPVCVGSEQQTDGVEILLVQGLSEADCASLMGPPPCSPGCGTVTRLTSPPPGAPLCGPKNVQVNLGPPEYWSIWGSKIGCEELASMGAILESAGDQPASP